MRRVVVTGANKGIGLAIVQAILEHAEYTYVYLGSRDRNRGQLARASLAKDQGQQAERVEVLDLNVASVASVAAAARTLRKRLGEAKLYGIVNNAGIGLGNGDLKAVLEVNTLGVRRVCEAFLPLLDAEKGRVVNISSASGPSFVAQCSPERQRVFINADIEWATGRYALFVATLENRDELPRGTGGVRMTFAAGKYALGCLRSTYRNGK